MDQDPEKTKTAIVEADLKTAVVAKHNALANAQSSSQGAQQGKKKSIEDGIRANQEAIDKLEARIEQLQETITRASASDEEVAE